MTDTEPTTDREAPDGRRTAIAGGANPRVTVVACGGTIASEPDDGGAAPAKTGDDLVAAVPGIERYAAVSAREVCSQPGFDVRWRDVLATATAAREAVADGADGVVVTHGTDPRRYRVRARPAHRPSRTGGRHGAQRRLDEPSSDVPANLTLAVRAAADDRFAPGSTSRSTTRSTPPATWSRATATRSTMTSPGTGPVATVTRAGSRLVREPRRGVDIDPLVDGIESADVVPEVPVIHSGTGVSAGAVERAVDAGVCGLVIEGTGLGNATAAIGDAVADVLPEVPVVVAGRPPAGPTEPVYGTPGGAVTLAEHGVTFAGPSRRRRRGSRSHSDSRPTSTATGKRATPMPTPSPTCSGRRKGKIDRRNTGKRSCLRETLMRAPRVVTAMIRRTRRTVLYGLGGGSVAALAGCTTEGDPGSGDGTDGSDGGDVGDGSDGAPETEVQQVGAALSGPAWDRESRRGFCTLFTDEDEIRWLFDDASAEVGEFVEATDFVVRARVRRIGRADDLLQSDHLRRHRRRGRDARRQRDRREHRRGRRALRRGDHLPAALLRVTADPLPDSLRLSVTNGWGETAELTGDEGIRDPDALDGFGRPDGDPGPCPRRSTARTTPSSAIPPPTRGRIVGIRRPRRR